MGDHPSVYDGSYRWYIEREWSCPYHDKDINNYEYDYYERIPPDYYIECLDCLFGKDVIAYDDDGWATLVFIERSAVEKAVEAYYLPQIKESLNREIILGKTETTD